MNCPCSWCSCSIVSIEIQFTGQILVGVRGDYYKRTRFALLPDLRLEQHNQTHHLQSEIYCCYYTYSKFSPYMGLGESNALQLMILGKRLISNKSAVKIVFHGQKDEALYKAVVEMVETTAIDFVYDSLDGFVSAVTEAEQPKSFLI